MARQDLVLALLKSVYFRAYFRIYLKEKINKKYRFIEENLKYTEKH